ncbi:MAG TPA: type III secretion system export apparatus subunit SctU [Rhodocyclaceae bacterium]|nr:type III secretion system export apparatus subunit SctU [Rhodocyclaceae bacterium]
MANNSGSGSQNKTEQPTQKRLRDARRDGDVPRSADFTSFVGSATGVLALAIAGGWMLDRLQKMMTLAMTTDFRTLQDSAVLLDWTHLLFRELAILSIPLAGVVAVVTLLAGGIQVGAVFSPKAVMPKLSRVSPMAGLQRMFAMRTLIELLKVIVKFAALAAVVCVLCRHLMPVLFTARYLPENAILPLASKMLAYLGWTAVGVYAVFAAFDIWYQRMDYRRRHRMSKDEVRREHKEMEGDPHVRGLRKQLQHEVSMQQMLENVRTASVVVVNPTHIAVALFYEQELTDLPVVVAKGEGEIARAIRETAEEAGVPILRDVQLARRLNEQAPIDQFIPSEFIEPVAAVLRWVREVSK